MAHCSQGVCIGYHHTVCLSDEGKVYSFGSGDDGQLGRWTKCMIPLPISALPIIQLISCGKDFTVCLDENRKMWSFGQNADGQLGLGNTTNQYLPQHIQEIPPVTKISCGPLPYLVYHRR